MDDGFIVGVALGLTVAVAAFLWAHNKHGPVRHREGYLDGVCSMTRCEQGVATVVDGKVVCVQGVE